MKIFQQIKRMVLLGILGVSCSSNPSEGYQKEARKIVQDMCYELHQVHSLEDLAKKSSRLKRHMNSFVELMVKAEIYYRTHDRQIGLGSASEEGDRFFYEMLRVSQEVEGAKEILEEMQQDALDRLDEHDRRIGNLQEMIKKR